MEENLFSVFFLKNTRFKEKFMRTKLSKVVALEIFFQKGSTCFFHEREVLHVKKIGLIFRIMALFREGREWEVDAVWNLKIGVRKSTSGI